MKKQDHLQRTMREQEKQHYASLLDMEKKRNQQYVPTS
jgi:hypothetical protein